MSFRDVLSCEIRAERSTDSTWTSPMKTHARYRLLFALCATLVTFAAKAQSDVFNMPAGQTSLITVPVGNQSNPADTTKQVDGTSGYGSVSYDYSIGKYDVTVGQYTAFLNAVAATDTYALWNISMSTGENGGILRIVSSGGYTYSVTGSANHPVVYVSWFDAARFANWLFNGQPTGQEGTGTTETGSYTLNGSNPLNVARNNNATWVIPSENEWYKAAYYNPATSTYYQYPYSSSNTPTSAMAGNTPNAGNFESNSGAFAVTGSTSYDPNQNYLTDVGAYTASASTHGAYDMGGEVFQWNETVISGSSRGLRGGSWRDLTFTLSSSYRYAYFDPSVDSSKIGFRVAVVPEPSTAVLALIGLAITGMMYVRHRMVLPTMPICKRLSTILAQLIPSPSLALSCWPSWLR